MLSRIPPAVPRRLAVFLGGYAGRRLPPAMSPEHAHFLFGSDFPGVLPFHQAQPILGFPGENPGAGRLPVFTEGSGGAALSERRNPNVADAQDGGPAVASLGLRQRAAHVGDRSPARAFARRVA